ncbi:Predicted kinase, aminoglycoside phosphotransferase (APT) family [Sphingobium faniae]|nr:Predicted kinase, aminoglycoside phosphotransferase (APT) family [Sphingobium faniae]
MVAKADGGTKQRDGAAAEQQDGQAGPPHGLLTPLQQPAIGRTLAAIRRDLHQILLPELVSDRARTVAISMDSALRHLIVRLDGGEAFIARLAKAEQDILNGADQRAGEGGFDWAAHLDHGAALEAGEDGSVGESVEKAFAALEAGLIDDFEASERALPMLGDGAAKDEGHVEPDRMTRYLQGREMISGARTVARVVPVAGGFSKETLFIEFSGDAGDDLVMRRDNPYGPIDSAVVEEYELLRCVHERGLPVAEPLAVEPDAALFGQPFMLSRKVAGRAIPHTTGLLEGEEHAAAGYGLARVLGQLHSLDVLTMRLPAYLRPDIATRTEHILAQIDYWEDCWHRYRSDYSPILTRGFRWLRAHVPQSPLPPCLVHGDAGPHNLMMKDGDVTAMLDWEFATLGDPMADLVYSRLFIDRIMNWDDFIATYRAHGGPEPDEAQVEFFTRFFAMRNAITSIRLLGTFAINPNPDLIACFGTIKYDRMFRRQLQQLI